MAEQTEQRTRAIGVCQCGEYLVIVSPYDEDIAALTTGLLRRFPPPMTYVTKFTNERVFIYVYKGGKLPE